MSHRHTGIFFTLASIALLQGCNSCNQSTNSQQSDQPSLIADYCFNNSVGTEGFDLTVNFSGTTSATAGGGVANFNQSTTKHFIPPTPRECVELRVKDLKSGAWVVTAAPNGIGAPLKCSVIVPGTVVLDVSGSQPTCR